MSKLPLSMVQDQIYDVEVRCARIDLQKQIYHRNVFVALFPHDPLKYLTTGIKM